MYLETKIIKGISNQYIVGCKGLTYHVGPGKWLFESPIDDVTNYSHKDLADVLSYIRVSGFKLPKKIGQPVIAAPKLELSSLQRKLHYMACGNALVIIKGCSRHGDGWRYMPPKDVPAAQLNCKSFEALVREIKAFGLPLPMDFGEQVPYQHGCITVHAKKVVLRLTLYPFWQSKKSICFGFHDANSFHEAMRSAILVKEMAINANKCIG